MTLPNDPTPGMTPAEGRDDLGIPGAERGDEPTLPIPGGDESPRGSDSETQKRDELAERVGSGESTGSSASGRPDLVTGTDVPDGQM